MPSLALAFIAGVALVFHCAALPARAALPGLALVAAVSGLLRCRALAGLFAGVLAAALQGGQAIADDWPCTRDREHLALSGRIVSPAEPRDGRVDFDFAVDEDGRRQGVPRRIRLSWYEAEALPRPGDTWRLGATLRCRSGFANPGTYDRELDLLRRGYGATGYVAGHDAPRRLASRPLAQPVEALRAWTGERIAAAAAGTRSAGVLAGLAVGLRGSIDAEIRDAFVATGTAHLIAISGMHVTAFATVALFALRWLFRFAARPVLSAAWPALQAAVVAGLTAAYGLLAGASLPTVRTVATVGVVLLLRTARRHVPIAEVLAASALLLTAADPAAVTSAGFWLSFGAVAALLGLVRAAAGPRGLLAEFVRAQSAVTVVLAPVLVGAFGGVPLVGPLANAVAIPLFSLLLLPATLGGTVLLPIAPQLAASWWAFLGAALDRCWPGLIWLGTRAHAVLYPPQAPGWLVAAGFALALAAVVVPGRAAGLPALAVLAALLLRGGPAPPPRAFDLTVLDVGDGLATVVRTAGHVLLFDTGPRWRSGTVAARVTVTPYLRAQGVRRLDRMVASHADADHAGGLGRVQQDFAVGEVIGDAGPEQRADRPCVAGERWRWDGVDFEIVHPPPGDTAVGNEASCALRVSGTGGSALLLADSGDAAERVMASRTIRADAVLVPHHGSAGSSSPPFVRSVGARWALVSAGFGNRWGLPRADVVARWQAAGATVATTAGGGALTLRFGPGAPPGGIEAWRESAPRWWRRR